MITRRVGWIVALLALAVLLALSCSKGSKHNGGDTDACPSGYTMGTDGTCHPTGGDSDADQDSDSEWLDNDVNQEKDDDTAVPADGDSDLESEAESAEPDSEAPDLDSETEAESEAADTEELDSEAPADTEETEAVSECQSDDDCPYARYCHPSMHVCTRDCGSNTECNVGYCCTIARGHCEICPADSDEADSEEPSTCASDTDCAVGKICIQDPTQNYCTIECGSDGITCPFETQVCESSDHPHCISTEGKSVMW